MSNKIMPWVDKLTEVGGQIVKRRDAIAAKLQRAEALAIEAQRLREEACTEALQLEDRISDLWTEEEILRAKDGEQMPVSSMNRNTLH